MSEAMPDLHIGIQVSGTTPAPFALRLAQQAEVHGVVFQGLEAHQFVPMHTLEQAARDVMAPTVQFLRSSEVNIVLPLRDHRYLLTCNEQQRGGPVRESSNPLAALLKRTTGMMIPAMELPVAPHMGQRVPNLWLRDAATGALIDERDTLVVGRTCWLEVNIGACAASSRLQFERNPGAPVKDYASSLTLSLHTATEALDCPAPLHTLALPASGNSSIVRFALTPQMAVTSTPLRLMIYDRWNLMQALEISVAITTAPATLPASLPTLITYSRQASWKRVRTAAPAELTLRLTSADAGCRISIAWDETVSGGEQLHSWLPISPQQIAQAVTMARNTLYDVTQLGSYRRGLRGTLKDSREALYRMAQAGNLLYTLLAHPEGASPEQDASLRVLWHWMQALLERASPPTLHIVQDGAVAGIPWGLLYPQPALTPDTVDALAFWGCRYNLDIRQTGQAASAGAPRQQARIVSGFHTFRVQPQPGAAPIDITASHRRTLSAMAPGPVLERVEASHALELLNSADIVYLFCHGHTGKASDDAASRTAQLEQTLANMLARPLTAPQQAIPVDLDLEDTWLKLDQGLLPLRLLKQWQLAFQRQPLVILNMCESAQLLPVLAGGFIPFFAQRGASAVLGTECPMLAPFAAAFGERLIQQLLRGVPAGTALRRVRRSLISRMRNPLGLAYTLYGASDWQLAAAGPTGTIV